MALVWEVAYKPSGEESLRMARHGWKYLCKYGTLSPPFGSQHMKRNMKTWSSKHENHKKNYFVVYNQVCLNNDLLIYIYIYIYIHTHTHTGKILTTLEK